MPASPAEKAAMIQKLLQLKDDHDGKGRSSLAQGIQQLISDINDGKRDASEVKILARLKIQKFNGKRLPESVPVEVQEFITEG